MGAREPGGSDSIQQKESDPSAAIGENMAGMMHEWVIRGWRCFSMKNFG